MNKSLSAILLLIACLFVPDVVYSIEGFPGSTWGELRWEFPEEEAGQENLILQGWIEQGIDWTKWGNLRLNTYATIRYKWDSEELDYNNSIGPGIGIALANIWPKGDHIKIGVEYIWDRFYKSHKTEEKAVIFMKWYGWWDLKKR